MLTGPGAQGLEAGGEAKPQRAAPTASRWRHRWLQESASLPLLSAGRPAGVPLTPHRGSGWIRVRAQRETQSPGWGLLAQRLLLPQDRSSLACTHTADYLPRE